MLSTTNSKLDVLVNKLHEYLAHSTVEDNDGTLDSEAADGLLNRRSVGNSTGHNVTEAGVDTKYSRRKPSVVVKHSGLDESGDSNASEDLNLPVNTNGHLDVTRLPKGTVLVRPEPVDNGRDDFRGPEFRSRNSSTLRKEFSRRRGGQSILAGLYNLLWCAEGGNLICCDFCSNAFCKKCILRNLGRKELSGILESKWYCYVCNTEPLYDLVMACNNVLENMEGLRHQQRKRNRAEPEKAGLFDKLSHPSQNIPLDKWDHTGMDGNVVFNYNTLQISKDITKKAKHLVDSANSLNQTFVNFIHTVTTNKQTPAIRHLYLKSFLSVVKGLRKSLAALEDSIKEEFSDLDVLGCWEKLLSDDFDTQSITEADTEVDISDERCLRDLRKLAGEHLDEDDSDSKGFTEGRSARYFPGEVVDSDSHEVRQRAQNIGLKLSESAVNMTKKLIVKLTPVPMEHELASHSPKMDIHIKVKKSEEKDVSEDKETCAKVNSKLSKDNSSASIYLEEEQGKRRSPRVKTTPLRRPSDVNAKKSLSAADSDSDSEETPSAAPAKNTEEQNLNRAGDDSDSDEVPAALLQRAAMTQSSDEPHSDEDGGKASPKVKMRRKRKRLGRSPDSDSSDSRVKVRRESGTDSSSDEEEDMDMKIQHSNTLRSIGKPHLVKREEKGVARKEGMLQAGKSKTKSSQETMVSSSSSSKDEHDDDDDSGSDASDQKMKPITDGVALLGATTFHQSSGYESCTFLLISNIIKCSNEHIACWFVLCIEQSAKEEDEKEELSDSKGTPKGRKKIRKIIEVENLRAETQEALREEEERCKRLANREQQMEDRREVIVIEDELSQVVCPITTKLVLDQDEETKEPLVQVHRNLVTRLKPHQVDGVQFIWDSCCESVKKANSSPGSGCILAHCMGLGKTLQVVAFLHTVLLSANLKFRTALVVCPLNTILNWVGEFKKWQNNMGEDKVKVTEMATLKHLPARLQALQRWQREGGVAIMGYDMYRILSVGQKISDEGWKKELKSILVHPGPDFVVCDEGHILRNDFSNVSKALNAIRTRRRVVLTGTPLQNNLNEYHCMVSFIKKNLLGSLSEFRNRFINPIENGQCADSTPKDVRIMKKRAHVLHAVLAGCVQRRDYSALTQFLPPKHEYVLAVRISPLQYKLYRYFLDHVAGVGSVTHTGKVRAGANLFKDFQVLSRIWTHPWCLHLSSLRRGNKCDTLLCTCCKLQFSTRFYKIKCYSFVWNSGQSEAEGNNPNITTMATADETISSKPQNPDKYWYKNLLSEHDAKILEHSGKMVLLFEILRMAEDLEDKVLVFSQSLISLDLIEDFLEASHRARDPSSFKEGSWIKNIDYYRLDGSTTASFRKKWTDEFNNAANIRGRLFLISTRAGSLGINLVAANRVIIFDASWNPSYDLQSIYRVYRFGQLKQVFVYRFLAQGTMEEKIYDRQVTKQSLSYRVVDQQQIERHFTLFELTELYTFEPDLLDDPNSKKSKRPTSVLPKDKILAQLLQTCKDQIVSYHEHESLLDHKQEEELSEAERKAAWAEYEAEVQSCMQQSIKYHEQQHVGLSSCLGHYTQ
uniref:DNA helicase n=1 Tax=Mastacembelus armatus TaxID=205130 RepID=A0A7N9AJY0_9TELE